MKEQVVCDRCNESVSKEETVSHGSRTVCEDCAMDLMSPAQACDPWAVKMASGSFQTKADAGASLQGVEKDLYALVVKTGRVPSERLAGLLGVSVGQLKRSLSTLRHMELLRGDRRSDGGADVVPFDS